MSGISPARRRALAKLHASRRGKRTWPPSRQRIEAIAALAAAVREPIRGIRSIRAAARDLCVSDMAVRNWLRGTDWPSPEMVARIAAWCRRVG